MCLYAGLKYEFCIKIKRNMSNRFCFSLGSTQRSRQQQNTQETNISINNCFGLREPPNEYLHWKLNIDSSTVTILSWLHSVGEKVKIAYDDDERSDFKVGFF